MEGLVYPDFARCVVPGPAPTAGKLVGGIDFGLRNPFAAVWGILTQEGILWLTGEHFDRDKSLAFHAAHLPHGYTWYGDPGEAREIKEFRCAGFAIRRGDNEVRPGIAEVRARLESGMLRVIEGRCPNLLAEAALYRYDPEKKDSEIPAKEHDHTMDALRYLVSSIDVRFVAQARRRPVPDQPAPPAASQTPPAPPPPKRKWLSIYNEALWTRIE